LARHREHEQDERASRDQTRSRQRWAICDSARCRKWRLLPESWTGTRYFCGGGVAPSAAKCAALDDWIVQCMLDDTVLAAELAGRGIHTVEGLGKDAAKQKVLLQMGMRYDHDSARIMRLY
jgi:hypothetical protein